MPCQIWILKTKNKLTHPQKIKIEFINFILYGMEEEKTCKMKHRKMQICICSDASNVIWRHLCICFTLVHTYALTQKKRVHSERGPTCSPHQIQHWPCVICHCVDRFSRDC